MTALHELTHARDLDALRTWLATTGTLDIADELSRLDPPERADALAKLRRAGAPGPAVHVLPVTDGQRCLVGVASLSDLVVADPATRIADLAESDVHSVSVDTDQEVAARP